MSQREQWAPHTLLSAPGTRGRSGQRPQAQQMHCLNPSSRGLCNVPHLAQSMGCTVPSQGRSWVTADPLLCVLHQHAGPSRSPAGTWDMTVHFIQTRTLGQGRPLGPPRASVGPSAHCIRIHMPTGL